ncbi:N-acetyl-1-D-myo-inositol-2-amino-2-deoxy-alpha-D-glucopyranoside deacetylase [Isoptericola sp. CG 20/1183]|uniref:N-acetyl-1-D-myo-inositol-2-amino-2-deoxy-alpha-D-glucopyranoside deacetylase n=1 Tax=Isoptericola halotolerans TaxID=300560 RepID=A0ABX5EF33_9MICO|nr:MULTISPECIES: PIG-L family deacetylase [Isoptericola]PRZ07758.1 N-acetyl-1-D-myo-inositol-2-amino-2-deoxy-alpha-D-glucopyranoside deacetylase [Isoptericola halotolerans]PRZ07883.1 N-acetyl-1-D-myo-inositol-2-amino-2-deoxy-alpha-D-glucopyranoside deacetylase [Isoptericola sp. CG 20/1183]
MQGGLLAVHAHPDDETLATGALVAARAAAGVHVTVVTCTRGERGEVIDTPSHPTGLAHLEGDGRALAAYRETELSAALAALGVADHVLLDTVQLPDGTHGGETARFEDSGMAWVAPGIAGPAPDSGPTAFARVPLDVAARRLASVVRDRRPSLVVTYEAGGGYGHPDHVRAHEVTVRALELATDPTAAVGGEPWRVPERWEVVEPAEDLRSARRALASDPSVRRLADDHGLMLPDPDGDLPPVAVPAADLLATATRTVDVAPVLDRVLAALAAHATQVQHAGRTTPAAGPGVVARYALSNGVLAPVLATAHLRRAATRPATPVGSAR